MDLNYCIVVTILEGKNFPVRNDKYLLVEARFDAAVMSTDPVAHTLHPAFGTELVWEVDKKGLQTHRLQRTPVKLQWFALDSDLTRKEIVGYVILDIRLAQEKLQKPQWFPLLNSKYQREKPEVLLLLHLERSTDDEIRPASAASSRRSSIGGFTRQNSAGSRSSQRSPSKNARMSATLRPVPCGEYYQIGQNDHCDKKFVLSVTLAFAANLDKLRPPAMLKSSKGFYFYYALFKNDVSSEKFSSLANPQFKAERTSVKILSSCKLLSEYFEHNSNLEILLCSGEMTLGSGQIPLGPLKCVVASDIDREPLVVEGSVQLVPVDKTSRLGGDDLYPFVGVTVVLEAEKEGEEEESEEEDESALVSSVVRNSSQPDVVSDSAPKQHKPASIQAEKNSPPSHESRSQPSVEASSGSSSDTSPRDPLGRPLPPPVTDSAGPHHWSFSIDLSHFAATRLSHPVRLFIRYSYPFFGTSSAMVTHPAVEVCRGRKVSIPHGYGVFHFTAPHARLKSTLWETPLILEAVSRVSGGREQLVGTAGLNLFQVLEQPASPHTVDDKSGMRQVSSCKVVVTSQEGYEIGEITTVLTLIDFGQTSELSQHHSDKCAMPYFHEGRGFAGGTDERLQAALELELWQERQREIFRAQLKEKEIQQVSALTDRFREMDAEREKMLQRKLQECHKIEDKLKTTLKDAEMKEKRLSSQQAELSMKLQRLNKQQEQQHKEAKIKIDSIKIEFNELLTLERLNVRELEHKNTSLLQQMRQMERDLQDQKLLIDKLKSQVAKDPDIHLRTEVNILNMEKAELEQKLECAVSSKHKYKAQWGAAVRQLSQLQQRLHAAAASQHHRNDPPDALKSMASAENPMLNKNSGGENAADIASTRAPANSPLPNPAAKSPANGLASNTTHSNLKSGDTQSNSVPSKPSSLIPKPVKDFHDLNGNTTAKDGNTLLSEKQKLLTSGYSERHKHIQDINAHIEKLAIK